MSAIADALASGGSYLKWEHPGTTYSGIITDVPDIISEALAT